MLASKPACFFERKTQDFTRYFQSLDINSCELIVIDRAGGTFSLMTPSFVPITCLLMYFGRALLYHHRQWALSNGKSAKVLFIANCGMRVAMDIGVICDDVMGFYRVSPSRRLRSFGCKFSWKGMGRHWVHRSERVRGALDEFAGEFGLGGGDRVIRAQRIC